MDIVIIILTIAGIRLLLNPSLDLTEDRNLLLWYNSGRHKRSYIKIF